VRDLSKNTMHLAVGFAAIGFLLIVLAWNGAASLDFVQGQIPFLISGGLAGVGLIGVGLTLALVMEIRRSSAQVAAKLDQVSELLAGAATATAGPTAVPDDGRAVLAGRTTYHRSGCRLVEGRHDLQVMGTTAAIDKGLAPCRICEPEAAGSAV
jgi:hypothetical protein